MDNIDAMQEELEGVGIGCGDFERQYRTDLIDLL
jgi:hypothetical protein